MFSINKRVLSVLVIVIIFSVALSSEMRGVVKVVKNTENIRTVSAASNDGVYTEKYRPQFHFSTPQGRLADPNGLVYFEGEYHLFHQKMGTWAHAVSEDLLHWEHLPIALEHDELGQALSGSAIVDWNDTTGFFDGEAGMVAFYTNTTGGEAQSIAYSKDNGRTWERYGDNPVIENPDIKDFRDPKVFWHEETEKWVMIVSTDKSVTFYNSDNLIDWEYQSRFGDGQGSHIAVWETPDLFRLPVDGDENNEKWVLHVGIGDNDVTDGSTSQYFIGEFDGSEFVNSNPAETVLYTDIGQDFYAAQSFSDIPENDGRKIWLGWMVSWRYPYQSPTEPWMGSMSIPRELTLRTVGNGGIRLFQEPINEIKSIRATENSIEPFTLEGDHKIENFSGTTYEFEAIVQWDDIEEFGIRLRQSEDEETVIGVNLESEKVFLDRTDAGLKTLIDRNGLQFPFGKRFEANFSKERKEVKIRGLVDESSVEVFIDDGEFVFTNLIYTKPTNSDIELYTKGGSADIVSLDFFHLYSTWREQPTEGELERIVVSDDEVELEVGESVTIVANAKPDWLPVTDSFLWEVAKQGIVEIDAIDESRITITGVELGLTTVTVLDPLGNKSKDITVKVSDDKNSEYTSGWGPSPVTGSISGNWDVIDHASISSQVRHNPEWFEIYREEVIKGNFTVSADIEWIDQGDEGFPKYGINIIDGEGTVVSAFFNKDIHQLETFAKYKNEDLGWEGVDLPTDTDLQEAQTLKIEKSGDTFIFYYNDEKMYERTVKMNGDISVGIINENTEAKFTNFSVDKKSDYIKGWGPSPVTGSISGNWDIVNHSNVVGLLGNSDDWTEIFKEQIITDDFNISADIKWLNQGIEGYPKYGIVIAGEEDTSVAAFFNKNIKEIETFATYKNEELGWEGVNLPADANLQEAQTLKIEKSGDTFIFYYNDKKMLERTVEMTGDISVGIVNINTEAEFTNFSIDESSEDSESNDNDSEESNNSGEDDDSVETNDSEEGNNSEIDNDLVEGKESEETNDLGGNKDSGIDNNLEADNVLDKALPNTATNIFNLLLIGFGTIFIGCILWFVAKRRSRSDF